MLRQLVEALLLHGRIRTTVTRAKEVRRIAERIVTWAKKGTLHHRRLAFGVVSRQDVVNRVFSHMVEWYRNRQGGYTRIIKIGPRPGDNAEMAFIEMVDWIPGEKLEGQHTKQVKKPAGEESQEDKEKAKKDKKEKKEKQAKAKVAEKKPKTAAPKDDAKEKKKAERQAEQEKRKQEKAAVREKAKQAKGPKKTKAEKPAKAKDGGK